MSFSHTCALKLYNHTWQVRLDDIRLAAPAGVANRESTGATNRDDGTSFFWRSFAFGARAAEPPQRRREAPARRRRGGEARMRSRGGTAPRREHRTNARHTLARLGCCAISLLNGPSRKKKHANAHRSTGIALGCCAIPLLNGPSRGPILGDHEEGRLQQMLRQINTVRTMIC